MAFVTPSAKQGDRNVRTKAYAIETEKSTSEELLRLIKKAYKASGSFIPFQMRSKHPDVFVRAISMQTQILSTNRTIVVNNIGTDAMMYLSHWIEQIEGVEEIVPYKTVEVDGRYRILTKLNDFHRIRNYIMEQLPQWYEDHVAPDAQPRFGRFPGDPEVAPIKSDTYSDDSYMASSINTIMAFDEAMFAEPPQSTEKPQAKNLNYQGTIPDQVQHPSTWADRVTQGRLSKQTPAYESDSSDSVQVRKDLQSRIAEVKDLKIEIENLKMEKAQYQAEIKRQVQEQVNTVIQAYLDNNSGSTGVTQNQFESFLEVQNKNFRDLRIQLMQMVLTHRSDMDAQQGVVTVPYGKRSLGTTGDTSSITDPNMEQQEDRKRLDCKPTLTKTSFPKDLSSDRRQSHHIQNVDGKQKSTLDNITISTFLTQEIPSDQDNHWSGMSEERGRPDRRIRTDRRKYDRQTKSEQTDADRSQTRRQQQVETDKRRHRRNDHRTTRITICNRRRRRTTNCR
jgi:hypothetical protein